MARPLKHEVADAVCHVLERGNAAKPGFENAGDRDVRVDLLKRSCERHGWQWSGFPTCAASKVSVCLETVLPALGGQELAAKALQEQDAHRPATASSALLGLPDATAQLAGRGKWLQEKAVIAAVIVGIWLGACPPAVEAKLISLLGGQSQQTLGGNALNGPYDVGVSSDGKHVYTVSTFGDSIEVFARNESTGMLTFKQALFDVSKSGTIPGLDGPRSLTIAPDGKHVYVASLTSSAVVVFSRNTTAVSADFGKLSHLQTLTSTTGTSALNGAFGITISGDGRQVYIASLFAHAVVVLSRNITTGILTIVESHVNGSNGVTGLASARQLAISADGAHLYVVSLAGRSVALFSRNNSSASPNFGKLTFVEAKFDGVGGNDGIDRPTDVAVSPDGKHVYVSNEIFSSGEDWIGIFSRNAGSGSLTYVSKLSDGASPSSGVGVSGNNGLGISPDGATVVASQNWAGAVVSLSRNSTTGLLTLVDWEFEDPETFSRGIILTNSVAISEDGKHTYTTSYGSPGGVSAFALSDANYASWIAATQPGSSSIGFNEDADGNGITNGVAYALGETYEPRFQFAPGTASLAAPLGAFPPGVTVVLQRATTSLGSNSWIPMLRYQNGLQTFIAPGVTISNGRIHDSSPPSGSAFYRFAATSQP